MSTDPWEEYYRAGWIVSPPLGSREGYSGDLLAQWQQFFGAIPSGSRIVDIGTGNGAIALIARDVAVARRVSFDIRGVDRAAIDPPRWVPDGARRYEGITFHSAVSAESLPFDDASVQAVSGQFALEFTSAPAALRELARVMEPGGQALFMLHHAESDLVAHAHESLRHGELILRQVRVFDRLRRLLEAARLEPRRVPALQRRLMRSVEELRRAAASSRHPQLLDGAVEALAQIYAARGRTATADLLKAVDRTEQSLRTTLQLLEALVAVALTPERVQTIIDAGRDWFDADLGVQTQGQAGVVAWRLALRRRRSSRELTPKAH